MIRTMKLSCAVLALSVVAGPVVQADILQINGIAPFNPALGTLTHVLVTLDPVPVQTDDYSSFPSISNHVHFVAPFPANVPGLGAFSFTPVQTSPESGPLGGDHNHTVNLLPSVQNYSGANLAWFLNQANPTINSVPLAQVQTNEEENHQHLVQFFPVVPTTRYTFDPVPEPASMTLALAASLLLWRTRRRV